MNDQTGEIAYWMSRAEDYQRERNELYKAWKSAEKTIAEYHDILMHSGFTPDSLEIHLHRLREWKERMTDAERIEQIRMYMENDAEMVESHSVEYVGYLIYQLDAAHTAMETARDAIATQSLINGSKIAYEALEKALGGDTK